MEYPLPGCSTLPSVPPGGEIELKLNEDEQKALAEFLRKVGFPDTPDSVEIRVNSIGFSDGTAWYGKMLKRGAGNVEWIRADDPPLK